MNLLVNRRTGTFVHAEQYYGIILPQNVVLYNFILPFRMVMVKEHFRLFVLEKLQRYKSKAFTCHEYIYPAVRMF